MSREREPVKNVGASVRARLLNLAKRDDRDFGAVLRLFFIERFLYRLSVSRYRDDFLLKGALLFFARADDDRRPFTRPTKDVDLEALALRPDLGDLAAAFRVIAAIRADDDGVRFEPDSVEVETIREDDRYGGIRAHLVAQLEGARDRIQIDIGFGDAVTPGPLALTYPTFLSDLPAPDLKAYPIETVVAEKWEATLSLGEANTRMKDLIDLDEIAGSTPLDGAVLQEAIRRTFERRRTPLDAAVAALTEAYANDRERQALWTAVRRRYGRNEVPERLPEAMAQVLAFVVPPYIAAVEARPFSGKWDPARRTWVGGARTGPGLAR